MNPIISVENLTTSYGEHIIHKNISFQVKEGEVFGILGGSGSGKSTLLNNLIMLQKPRSGKIRIFNNDITSPSEKMTISKQCGILFQFGALFSSLNVLENAGILLEEYSHYPKKVIEEISKIWLDRVGLGKEVYHLYPYELSGGMKKRVALARTMVLNPKILFLDEPTSGLDPLSAGNFDNLIVEIKKNNPLTVVLITHDLDTVQSITDRFILLKDSKIEFEGNLKDFAKLAQQGKIDKDNLFNCTRGEKIWKDA